jgi:hypothetical protein
MALQGLLAVLDPDSCGFGGSYGVDAEQVGAGAVVDGDGLGDLEEPDELERVEALGGNGLDPLVGIQRAHVELYIRDLGESGLMASSVNTSMHAVRGFFRFAHIDGLTPNDPAFYARLPKIHADESRPHRRAGGRSFPGAWQYAEQGP